MTDEPVSGTKPTKGSKADEPASSPATPADDTPTSAASDAASAGTDPYGRQLYEVTCASCGKPAQVPFKPAGDRPVYCRDCYMQQRQQRTGGGMGRGPRR